jgi:hypothetical protein
VQINIYLINEFNLAAEETALIFVFFDYHSKKDSDDQMTSVETSL